MFLCKSIMYTCLLSYAFAPIYTANETSSKSPLSSEDIEKISDQVVEKLANKQNDPEHRAKMIRNHKAFQSEPEMQEFRLQQMLKDLSNSQFQEARRQQMIKDQQAFINENPLLKTCVTRKGTIIVVFAVAISFTVGYMVGSK